MKLNGELGISAMPKGRLYLFAACAENKVRTVRTFDSLSFAAQTSNSWIVMQLSHPALASAGKVKPEY